MPSVPSGPMSLKLHHYCVVVPDLDEAVRWYGDKLDFGVERRFGFPEVGTKIAHVVNADGIRIELIARDGSASGPDANRDVFDALLAQGSKHIGFLVADMEATAQELRRRGVEFVMEANAVEPAEVKNFWIRDPGRRPTPSRTETTARLPECPARSPRDPSSRLRLRSFAEARGVPDRLTVKAVSNMQSSFNPGLAPPGV